MKTALDELLATLGQDGRERTLKILRDCGISDTDPLLVCLALMRSIDSEFARKNMDSAEKIVTEIREFSKKISSVAALPEALANSVKSVQADADGLTQHVQILEATTLEMRRLSAKVILAAIVGAGLSGFLVGVLGTLLFYL